MITCQQLSTYIVEPMSRRKWMLLVLFAVGSSAVDARESKFPGRALLELPKAACDRSPLHSPNHLVYAETQKNGTDTWVCFLIQTNKTGTWCDDKNVPKAHKTCCGASQPLVIDRVEFAVASNCTGTVTSAVLSVKSSRGGLSQTKLRVSYAANKATSDAVLSVRDILLSQEYLLNTNNYEYANICFSLKAGKCPAARLFPVASRVQYRIYDTSRQCCPEGVVATAEPGLPSPSPPPPPLPPPPSPQPRTNVKCTTNDLSFTPWRIDLSSIYWDDAGYSIAGFDVTALPTQACNNTSGCCGQNLRGIEIIDINPKCLGARAPWRLDYNSWSQTFSWDYKVTSLRYPSLNFSYQTASQSGYYLQLSVGWLFKPNSPCQSWEDLCMDGVCKMVLYTQKDNDHPNTCCATFTVRDMDDS